jgi:hypothetical protein
MRLLHSARWLLLALLLSVIPASSYAGVFISVSFAPPVLPVYEQPPCPESGWMWIPGYWAYGDDGYYWVPGTWVPAPYEGALWTPGYWGWSDGFYVWYPGYWADHVGYYGGVDYGFGYMGIGFVGGMWRGHDFVYNRAIMRVDETRIHNTYIDRRIVERNTIRNDRRISFSGGRDGIRHDPSPRERIADRDRHVAASSYQTQHESAARSDRNLYFRNNNGRPSSTAVARPMTTDSRTAPGNNRQMQQGTFNNRQGSNAPSAIPSQPTRQTGPANQTRQSQPSNQTQQMNQAQPTNKMRQPEQVRQYNQTQPTRQVQQPSQTQQTRQTQQSNQTQQMNQAQPTNRMQQAPQSRQAQQPAAQSSRQGNQSKPSAESKSKPKSSDKHDSEDRGRDKER